MCPGWSVHTAAKLLPLSYCPLTVTRLDAATTTDQRHINYVRDVATWQIYDARLML